MTVNTPYGEQDRGNAEKYAKYLSGMDTIIVEKVASASVFFSEVPDHAIVDVGMASGTSSYILALLFPNTKIIGVDINPKMVEFARESYALPNLEFIVDDGEKLENLPTSKICGFFNCSSIHHITSFNNYNIQKAYNTIKRQQHLLCEGGIIVIRDFVKPDSQDIVLEFPDTDRGTENADLLLQFAKSARSLSPASEKGFPIKSISERQFKLDLADATEFIRRKDYLDDWDVELQEEYAYYSQTEFEEIFRESGFRTIVSAPIFNPWIVKNRYKNQFKISSLNGNDLGFPPTNYVIAAEKVENRATALKPSRKLPVLKDSFLKVNTYISEQTNQRYEIAERPNPVIDLLPYYENADGKLIILAKHGYPRPIIAQTDSNQLIDKKHYSGYITESITAMKTGLSELKEIEKTLAERAAIDTNQIIDTQKSLKFYTTPGGVDELVDSYFIHINPPQEKLHTASNSHCDFEDFGSIRSFDAIQFLKSIQVGAIPDIRLEINVYNLLHTHKHDLGKWLNGDIAIKEIDNLCVTKFWDIKNDSQTFRLDNSKQNNTFLQHKRCKYYEYQRENSQSILEYIVPENLSINTVVTLPVYYYKEELYLGIEERHLPVPYIQEGDSRLLAAPAFRVPKGVDDFSKLETYIMERKFGTSRVTEITKLGEKYFPCTGVTPEQAYPYVVSLDKPTDTLLWVSAKDLYENRAIIRDGHLLLNLLRIMHSQQINR